MDFDAVMAQTVRPLTQTDASIQTLSGTGVALIEDVALLNTAHTQVDTAEAGAKVTVRSQVRNHQDLSRLVLGYMITYRLRHPIDDIKTYARHQALDTLVQGDRVASCGQLSVIPYKGTYSIALSLSCVEPHLDKYCEWRGRRAMFHDTNAQREGCIGSACLNAHIDSERSSLPRPSASIQDK